MTNKEIFKKVIEKAVKNGWTEGQYHLKYGVRGISLSVIFSHDFAKAFWGEEEATWCEVCGNCKEMDCWQYHLQEMVLEKEPLKYIERFL